MQEVALNKKQINKIAGAVELDHRTVRKAYTGQPLRYRNWQLIRDVAEQLGLPAPAEWRPL